jgi:transcriptional regulator with XRE-family HTH domain
MFAVMPAAPASIARGAGEMRPVGPMLRAWRTSRGKSQLALAVEAGVSTRHLSFVETGRAAPSRQMVLTLAEHLEVPLRDRNSLLEAAGYAAMYRETPLDDSAMTEVRAALTHLLEASLPNPSLVVNRRYDILLANTAAVDFFSFFAPNWKGKNNVAHLVFSESGLKPAIVDWPAAAGYLARRLRGELGATLASAQDEQLMALAHEVEQELAARTVPPARTPQESILIPVTFRRGEMEVDVFTAITTLGTPLDITLQELRIETFFPVDARSRRMLERVLRQSKLD